jgi:hypothetical protein
VGGSWRWACVDDRRSERCGVGRSLSSAFGGKPAAGRCGRLDVPSVDGWGWLANLVRPLVAIGSSCPESIDGR